MQAQTQMTMSADMTTQLRVTEQPDARTPQACLYYCDMPTQTAKTIVFYMTVVAMPIICAIGVFGNISSMIVLKRNGLSKSCNLLLFGMAIGDLLFVLGVNNAWGIWSDFYKYDYTMTRTGALAFYAFVRVQDFTKDVGIMISVGSCTLIACERLVAVYFPFKLDVIMSERVKIAGLVFAGMLGLLKGILNVVRSKPIYNGYRLSIGYSDTYLNNQEVIDYIITIYSYFVAYALTITIFIISVLIIIKVTIAARRRSLMMSSGNQGTKSSDGRKNRTTLTLLTVCVFYLCTNVVASSLESFYPATYTYRSYILRRKFPFILFSINSSFNFVIYILWNERFRDTYVEIFCCREGKRYSSSIQTQKLTK